MKRAGTRLERLEQEEAETLIKFPFGRAINIQRCKEFRWRERGGKRPR